MTASAGKTIGVRLNGEAEAALEQEALRRGMKPTTAARELILEALSGAGSRAVAARLDEIEGLISRIDRELPDRIAITLSRVSSTSPAEIERHDDPRSEDPLLSLADFIKTP